MPVANPKMKRPQFNFAPFSLKQQLVFKFWMLPRFKDVEAIICDGSVRSGKTLSMIISFIEWSMTKFNNVNFGIAGKSIGSLRKNVIDPMKNFMAGWSGMDIKENRSENTLTITFGDTQNRYYLYGGKDEKSFETVQGLTAKGFFFDEVALQPKSFVDQATSRVDDSNGLFWFNCNPAGPYHWFYRDWIVDDDRKHYTLQLHFRMEDNLYLSQKTIERFKRMYSGVFYERYILGKWVLAEGLVYNFDEDTMIKDLPDNAIVDDRRIGCDYGGDHPFVYTLAEHNQLDNTWYFTKEYYYDGEHRTLFVTGMDKPIKVDEKDDNDFLNDLGDFLGGKSVKEIIIDPSAKTFRTMLKKHGYKIKKADNSVIDGIKLAQMRLNQGKVKIGSQLPNAKREMKSYAWDTKARDRGLDKVIKMFDHWEDAFRYTVKRILPVKKNTGGLKLFD